MKIGDLTKVIKQFPVFEIECFNTIFPFGNLKFHFVEPGEILFIYEIKKIPGEFWKDKVAMFSVIENKLYFTDFSLNFYIQEINSIDTKGRLEIL